MTDTNVSSLVLKKGSNRYIFDPSGNLDLSNYYTKSDIDTKLNTKANVTHSHNISDITNLQSQLNSKAASNHTHSQYATTAAVTNAQNTANNALNVANSKASFNINKKIYEDSSGNANSVTLPTNAFGYASPYWDSGTVYQNGINIYQYINGNNVNTLFAANSAITCSESRMKWAMLSV